ncbi:MAG: 2-amino-4-hydroxy-6-hydroxymethyldihydropteridine diphosphokinase [Ktedonobacterales bacterium]
MPNTAREAAATPPRKVYLGLGSNLGDRDGLLRAALARLRAVVALDRVSSVYDTAPLLVTEQPRFHNLVASGWTTLEPLALLAQTQATERALGRVAAVRYGPRAIDIDLLFYDDLAYTSAALTLPHPRIAERAFVLAPLAEIAPRRRLPVLGETAAHLLRALGPADVHRLGPLLAPAG